MSDSLHVAIIMDGNGRWARERGLPRTAGHHTGVKSLREVVEFAVQRHIHTLTLYAFSSDNWQRPKKRGNGSYAYSGSAVACADGPLYSSKY